MSDDASERESPHEIPDPRKHPVKAAENMLRQTRGEMSGELFDEHKEVREWAMNIEWAYTALSEHGDSDYDAIEEASDYE